MKITYDMQEAEHREIVAFINGLGTLVMKGDTGESIMITPNGAYEGALGFYSYMEECGDVKIFYRGSGDSVTITF